MLHFPFHIGAGNVERSVLRSLYDHLIQDVERLTEFLLFLFQSSQSEAAAVTLRVKFQQTVIINPCSRIISTEDIDIGTHQQSLFILLVFIKHSAIVGISTVRPPRFHVDSGTVEQNRDCQRSEVQCKRIGFECLVILAQTTLHQAQIGKEQRIFRILRFQFQCLEQQFFRPVKTVLLNTLYRFLGQLLIGLRTQRNRKAEQQRYNNSYHTVQV